MFYQKTRKTTVRPLYVWHQSIVNINGFNIPVHMNCIVVRVYPTSATANMLQMNLFIIIL